MARGDAAALPSIPTAEPAKGRSLRSLLQLLRFLAPYRLRLAGAAGALLISSASVLLMGQGIARLVDQGLGTANGGSLDRAVEVLLAVVGVLALSTYSRFYLVSWIGERVVADLRMAVFDRILRLSPAYFEVTKTGEVLSRLTTDTTLLQTVIGSSVSLALRNTLILLGGLVMLLAIQSAQATPVMTAKMPALRPRSRASFVALRACS